MAEWDSLQLKDGPGGHSSVFNPPDFAIMMSSPLARIAVPAQQTQPTDTRTQQTQPTDTRTQQTQPTDARVQAPQAVDNTSHPATLTDAQLTAAVVNGKLTLKYGDPALDEYLARAKYNAIDITVPQGVQVKHWIDPTGNFFWFQGGNDNGAHHYYPATAKAMTVNGQSLDLDAQRLKVDDAYASTTGGFQSFTKQTDAPTYFARMAGLSGQALQTLENSLTNSVKNSDNPYFKIYLADVYTAEAMQPIVQQVMQGGKANPNNQQTLQKLDQAIALTQMAQVDSRTGLSRTNVNPPGNVIMPLDPYDIYSNPNNPQYYNGFWGGSYQQAQARQVALTTLRNLISSNALPTMQLPPALPPKY